MDDLIDRADVEHVRAVNLFRHAGFALVCFSLLCFAVDVEV